MNAIRHFQTRELAKKRGITYIEHVLTVANLPRKAENTLLVFVTDLHYGSTNKHNPDYALINHNSLKGIVATINNILTSYAGGGISEKKVILLFGGDLINIRMRRWFISHQIIPETKKRDAGHAVKLLQKIKANTKVFVLGNHEIKYTQQDWIIKQLENAGFVNIENPDNYINYKGLTIAGIHDCTFLRGESFQKQFLDPINKKLESDDLKIILAHNPMVFDKKHFNLKLTKVIGFGGHVHAGHIDPTGGIPRRVLHKLVLKILQHPSHLVNGLYKSTSKILEVSAGLGDYPIFSFFGKPTRSTARTVSFTLLKRA